MGRTDDDTTRPRGLAVDLQLQQEVVAVQVDTELTPTSDVEVGETYSAADAMRLHSESRRLRGRKRRPDRDDGTKRP